MYAISTRNRKRSVPVWTTSTKRIFKTLQRGPECSLHVFGFISPLGPLLCFITVFSIVVLRVPLINVFL